MKKFGFLLLPILLFSCKENSSIKKNADLPSEEKNVVENIETKSTDPFQKTYRTNAGMVEDIYSQLLLKDKNLAKLDTQIKNLNTKTTETISVYENVLANSDNYYKDAQQKTTTFKDSLMRKKVDSVMVNSFNNYAEKTANVRNYIAAAKSNITIINDNYDSFKIFKTLPEIEKYQNTNSFDLTNINKLMAEQNKILTELKKAK
ncbi:hypothetical protein [Frigoriflavimonas asaccharolytica]|uniref:Putative nucleic acid-binding Zn-ribbon protein n=1 Tax=Frigoriflavimonas asaccharolytica TaxID=2735899 RepID=A0A8J8K726_9FLAO|nr:hypothetical protein [Frigoriflavimonas asaccharolytica]NRS91563.1 putative nucleic acid-binding Zn-ribbon protein [Frigoriflavimonas asaccharolytica]